MIARTWAILVAGLAGCAAPGLGLNPAVPLKLTRAYPIAADWSARPEARASVTLTGARRVRAWLPSTWTMTLNRDW